MRRRRKLNCSYYHSVELAPSWKRKFNLRSGWQSIPVRNVSCACLTLTRRSFSHHVCVVLVHTPVEPPRLVQTLESLLHPLDLLCCVTDSVIPFPFSIELVSLHDVVVSPPHSLQNVNKYTATLIILFNIYTNDFNLLISSSTCLTSLSFSPIDRFSSSFNLLSCRWDGRTFEGGKKRKRTRSNNGEKKWIKWKKNVAEALSSLALSVVV